MSLVIHPLKLREAAVLVKRWHRHHKPAIGSLFAIGIARAGEEEPCGCIVVGRPVAINLDDGWTVEATRCCTDGTKNACSMLYRAAWRAARAMGYRKLVTYTLPEEGGSSLRGAGFTCLGEAGGGTWHRPNVGRPRVDMHPMQKKLRWEVTDANEMTREPSV